MGAYFPFSYLRDFLAFLSDHRRHVEVLTYDDLPWGADFDHVRAYPGEYATWDQQLRRRARDPRKVYVILQHDIDSAWQRAVPVLQEEERLRIRSNVMVFCRRVSRRTLQRMGRLEYTEYPLDVPYLQHLQDAHGFTIGYHCNAYEQAYFDAEGAEQIFEGDVAALRDHFHIRYFSPHGGARDSRGRSNTAVQIPASLRRTIRWVANGYSVRLESHYSDGAINSTKLDPRSRDLRAFVRTWRPGHRYRVLLHPQYYGAPVKRSPRLSGAKWYEDVLACYRGDSPTTAWHGVELLGVRAR